MDQAEGGGREELPFLALAGGRFHQLRGIPLAEEHLQALQLEPPLEQVNLGGFPSHRAPPRSCDQKMKFSNVLKRRERSYRPSPKQYFSRSDGAVRPVRRRLF
jgi:hypothetical protein